MSGPTFEVFTLFPEAIAAFLRGGLVGKALAQGLVAVHCTDFRDFTSDRHRTVDDAPYGGGAGMVMKIEPVVAALEAVEAARGPMHRILVTPSAPRFDQRAAERLARLPRLGILCGRYEGIDDRVREGYIDECLSLGDFVLNGGEVAALAIIEAVSRLCEGVIGNPDSALGESFSGGVGGAWLEHPHYTRPPEFRGRRVPAVLLGGDHGAIARWRAEAAWRRTWEIRPDLRALRPRAERRLVVALDLRGVGGISSAEIARFRAEVAPLLADTPILLIGPRRLDPGALRDLRDLRRRIRRELGEAPQVVEICSEGRVGAIHRVAELLDLLDLRVSESAGRPPVVLLLTPRGPEGGEGDRDVDAVFAPDLHQGAEARIELAPSPQMIESSQPWLAEVTHLAVAVFAHLRARSVGGALTGPLRS